MQDPSLRPSSLLLVSFVTACLAAGSVALALEMTVLAALSGSILLMALLAYSPLTTSSAVMASTLLIGSLNVPQVAGVSLLNVALAGCVFCLAVSKPISRTKATASYPIWSAAALLVIVISFDSFSGIAALSTPVLVGVLALQITRRNPAILLVGLGVAGMVHAVVGLTESIFHASVNYTDWKDPSAADVAGIRRAASTIGDPNYLAATLIACAPGVVLVLRKCKPSAAVTLSVGYLAAFILTFSRGAFLAAAMGLIFYMWIERRNRGIPRFLVFGTTAGVGGLALFLSPLGSAIMNRFNSADASTESRWTLQSATFELFQQNWVNGVGLGALSDYLAPIGYALVPLNAKGDLAFLPQTDPLNTYLLVAAESGVLALALCIVVLYVSYVRAARTSAVLASAVICLATLGFTLDLLQALPTWAVLTYAIHQSAHYVDSD